jgi:hypothetical protein
VGRSFRSVRQDWRTSKALDLTLAMIRLFGMLLARQALDDIGQDLFETPESRHPNLLQSVGSVIRRIGPHALT